LKHLRRARLEINLDALSHNLNKAREYAPGCSVMAVIKANAYGHGMLAVAEQLADADMLAVAMPQEAYALREAGSAKDIIVLHGFCNAVELAEFSRLKLSSVIHQQAQIDSLMDSNISSPVDCWLKVDTGMHRLGISVEQADECIARLEACDNVSRVYVMSHFANADHPDNNLNNIQLKNIHNVNYNNSAGRSMANSAAIMRLPDSHFEVVRPGIMLYGSSPFHDVSAADLGLQAVMQFESILIDVKVVRAGESIGYGSTLTVEQDTTIGIVAAGYGDGYSRHARNGTPVWVNNQLCGLLGRVSMDSLVIDLNHAQAKTGDRVVLWGRELSVDKVAECCNTIAYELLCNAGAAYFSS
jgi:alanine racemase